MIEPSSYFAYAPRGPGLLCAVFYFPRDPEVCGWRIGSADSEYRSAYFMLEDYFSTREGHYLVTRGEDLHGGWVCDLYRPGNVFDRAWPVDETLCHELSRLQAAFAAEWLCFADDPEAAAEHDTYAADELAISEVCLRHRKLGRLDKCAAVWRHWTPGIDMNVIEHLARDWPLDFELF
jgi:hypothetical protein